MYTFSDYLQDNNQLIFVISSDSSLNEDVQSTRYSVEVNYRTTPEEALEAFAKICLGYVSAGIKHHGFHVKHVYSEKPIRILVSSRNWDDGEHVALVSWHADKKYFVLSTGYYNRDRRTVSIQQSHVCQGKTAADITKEVYNMIHHLKNKPDRHQPPLKAVPLKRGPKQ